MQNCRLLQSRTSAMYLACFSPSSPPSIYPYPPYPSPLPRVPYFNVSLALPAILTPRLLPLPLPLTLPFTHAFSPILPQHQQRKRGKHVPSQCHLLDLHHAYSPSHPHPTLRPFLFTLTTPPYQAYPHTCPPSLLPLATLTVH